MMHVWYSNQLERLADRLIENLGKPKRSTTSRLFRMPTIIVPNRNIETYLKYEIAQWGRNRGRARFQGARLSY